jgi:GDP-4-dehydro-6-deoxy-D-mannose reductase
LVTGACGFVGRHLVSELVSAGCTVCATDILEEAPEVLSGVRYRPCDLLDQGRVEALLDEWRPEAVYHLAARSSAAQSFEDPAGTLETNLFGTLNILEAVRWIVERSPDRRFRILTVGSSEEYGRRSPDEMPLTEDSRIEPVSPYAVSKAAQGMLVLQYRRSYGIDCVITRSFSHTGPGQSERFVLPAFSRQCAEIAAGLKDPVLRVGNLEVVRDFLDVRDVVRAYRLLMEKGRSGTIYNVCSGHGLALDEALRKLTESVPGSVSVETDPGLLRPVDVPVMIGDSSRLKRDTGWEPEIGVDRMLADLTSYWERVVVPSTADDSNH